MFRSSHLICSLVLLIGIVVGGCASAGESDDFGGGPALPPALAERPTPGDGASLFAANCARCHQERWPTERTDAQWETLMLHMRGICLLNGEDAEAILAYLQSSN